MLNHRKVFPMPTTTPLVVLPTGDAHWYSDELIDEMLAAWGARGRSQPNARSTLRMFAAWLDGRGTGLLEATTADCRAWLTERASEVAPSTVVKNWSQLVAFYRTAERHSTDPLAGRRSPGATSPAAAHSGRHPASPPTGRRPRRHLRSAFALGLRNAMPCPCIPLRSRVGETPPATSTTSPDSLRAAAVPETPGPAPTLHPPPSLCCARDLHPPRGDAPPAVGQRRPRAARRGF